MSRRGRKTKRAANYVDDPDSSDEFDAFMVSSLLSIFASHRAPRTKKPTTNKRKPSCQCDDQNCRSKANKQAASRSTSSVQSKSRQRNGKNTETKSTTAAPSTTIDLDSDNEAPNAAQTKTYEASIHNKIDNVFKALESSDEGLSEEETRKKKACVTSSSEPKPKDFYTILSDSEGEDEKRTLDNSNFKVSFVTYGPQNEQLLSSTSSTNISNATDNSLTVKPKKNATDLLSYVDDILNECDVIDLDHSNKSSSILRYIFSLDDLKKNANAILNDVTSYAEVLQPKEPEAKKPDTPVKEVPTCPICLENLGGSRQAMATLCGHIFCRQCLNQVMKTTKKCPSCRVKLNKAKYHAIYI
ncbi:BRCA1-associated protein-like isoform X3 [Dendroctonus ponderosae]|uniref:RING-type domain-containing protein n=2 Tax=Dendroctonus ponderosae TaxID=77166 RepID=U4TTI0_DENPD|nr:BRCA1-associated protein isoform X3 [Dendroctonus ponderosae]XP_048524694.1 BRCA1-associated protein isoform X3 [Dendroctonus ponderosae]XP_048524695.1 BRCA1-associated protein isoform X3 [Dendroctonus ponderosae]XP_048524696.1 BRCA1-associated protein isoform X3 [Dendroctonus ponderosae]XP_048524708.1 BRCA1-associated protein-like isoform X3 [Dendroctonus ponderosae]XP_048524709.1 BRCA1-associated protein-like isoform X3 [Dendroctonus ponderosae]XP_048524710.1 BRCA1-associated protein-lik